MQDTQDVVRLERVYKASPSKVREAWTDPKLLATWFAPPGMTCTVQTYDLRVGGQFEITMHGEDGSHTATGTFRAVGDLEISMSWNWNGEASMPNDSTLTIKIEPQGEGTKLTLLHTDLPNADAASHHEKGWIGCLASLETLLEER